MTLHRFLMAAIVLNPKVVDAQCGPGGNQPYPPGSTTCPTAGGPAGGGTGGGLMGGGNSAPSSTSPHAVAMLGNVALTFVAGTTPAGKALPIGTNIYGPFEAGFTSQQNEPLQNEAGCPAAKLPINVPGGVDVELAEQVVAFLCGITLPSGSGASYKGLVDECGGHTMDYHFHMRLSCLFGTESGHSIKVGRLTNNQSLYGKWEVTSNKTVPSLDACGGHFGRTPESPEADVYHYHVQDDPPFTVGCIGPNDANNLVTVAECRSYYTGCDGLGVVLTTSSGSVPYDDWCPCYYANGSNVPGGALKNTTTSAPAASANVAGAYGIQIGVAFLSSFTSSFLWFA